MSIAFCDCGQWVDTDYDGDFYYQTLESGEEVETDGKCGICRGE